MRLHQYGFSVLACDRSKKRLRTFATNCERMGFDIPSHRVNWLGNITVEDVFDVVLLDAPCSGLGVLRRHPEIRWRRTPQDITVNSIIQKQLIDVLYPMVKEEDFLCTPYALFEEERGQTPQGSQCLVSWETPLESGEDAFSLVYTKSMTDQPQDKSFVEKPDWYGDVPMDAKPLQTSLELNLFAFTARNQKKQRMLMRGIKKTPPILWRVYPIMP